MSSATREQRFLGDLLVRRGLVAEERLEPLYAVQKERGVDLVDLLVNQQLVEPVAVARAIADEAQLPVVDTIDPERVPNAIATRTPITFAKSHRVLAYAEDEQNVFVYCADPFVTGPLDDLRLLFGKPVECTRRAGREDRRRHQPRLRARGGRRRARDRGRRGPRRRGRRRHPRLRRRGAGHPLGQLALPPGDEGARQRHPHRAGGEGGHRPLPHRRRALRRAPSAAQLHERDHRRIKIESALNIAEKRLPQDGRITKKIAGKGFDIRVSHHPVRVAATSASSCVS